jgi:hypothetical protein
MHRAWGSLSRGNDSQLPISPSTWPLESVGSSRVLCKPLVKYSTITRLELRATAPTPFPGFRRSAVHVLGSRFWAGERGQGQPGVSSFPERTGLARRTWKKMFQRLAIGNIASYRGPVRSEEGSKRLRRLIGIPSLSLMGAMVMILEMRLRVIVDGRAMSATVRREANAPGTTASAPMLVGAPP